MTTVRHLSATSSRSIRLVAHQTWDQASFERLVAAARDRARVSGLTHNFYRYPARFSPRFVRAAIEMFTEPGDLIFDPFMGGGTTLVEAMALGRRAAGTDISSLAAFVSEVKTLILTDEEMRAIERWRGNLSAHINLGRALPGGKERHSGDDRNLQSAITWRLRKAIHQALATTEALPSERLQKFGRCIILRTGQWALDGRKQLPNVAELRVELEANAAEMLEGAREFRDAVSGHTPRPTATCINRSIVGFDAQNPFGAECPKLVVTSPPYPGVHVLYHRWQVDGRKESAAPFWIANKLDGSGGAYYTLGDRRAKENRTYFEGLRAALTAVAAMCDRGSTVVQMVAFSDPGLQLPRFLEVAESAGLTELAVPAVLEGSPDGRLWRVIPNRKWHADQLGNIPASQEVVLFHRKT